MYVCVWVQKRLYEDAVQKFVHNTWQRINLGNGNSDDNKSFIYIRFVTH